MFADPGGTESVGSMFQGMGSRYEVFTQLFDFTTGGSGLEIGPLAQPVVPPGQADIEYVDLAPRSELVARYAGDPHVDTSAIPEIHYWLSDGLGGTRSLPEAVGGKTFDFAIASHVIEHVPNLLGWLAEIADLLVDGGVLLLAVPDRRFSFDALRPATSVGQALQAFYDNDRSPNIRAVYDQTRNHVLLDPADVWGGRLLNRTERVHALGYVQEQVQRVMDGEYVDTHVWTFTPAEFVDLIGDVGQLGLLNLVVDRVIATPRGLLEFYVVLRRQARGLDSGEAAEERARALYEVQRTLPDEAMLPAHQVL